MNNFLYYKKMTLELKKISSKLKPYHIIIMSCLLATIMIINSNNVNKDRALMKENVEKDVLFRKIIGGRLLSERNLEVNNHENSEKVCSKGSDDLIDYYKTGDPSKIGLDDDDIKCEDKDTDYMKALIDLVRNNIGDNKKNTDTPENLRMIEEESSDDKDNIIKYGMRILPMVIFLVIGIFSIFGWIACCICNCCDCCCCCCCKKKTCKIPCFIFTFLFYGLVVAVCLYGLTQSNKIFKGLINVECSLLKLLEQVVDGEIKQTLPRWIGISGIQELLGNLNTQINNLKDNTVENLRSQKAIIQGNKTAFTTEMNTFENTCNDDTSFRRQYEKQFSDLSKTDYNGKTYILDIINLVGKKNSTSGEYPENTFLYALNIEYSEISERTDGYVNSSEASFNDILNSSITDVTNALNDAQNTLDDLRKPFDDINNEIGDKVTDYSDKIDKYGKLVVKLVFSILMVMNIFLGVFIALIGLCSMKACADCCFCRCLFKSALHILWNILALMMVLSFLVGSVLALVGRVGADAMSLISFVISAENFANNNDPLLLGELGDAKKYLEICLHGNGSLENEFDLGDSLDYIEDIDRVFDGLNNATQTFNNIKENLPVFNRFKDQINHRKDFDTELFGIIGVENPNSNISVTEALLTLNNNDKAESWKVDGDKTKACNDVTETTPNFIFHPLKCKPIDRNWISNYDSSPLKDYAIIISSIVEMVNKLGPDSDSNSFLYKVNLLEKKYHSYLDSYIDMLVFLNNTIGSLIGEIKGKVGNGQLFSFVNGKFIGINIKIILKYLKYSLGEDLYTVGICLIIVGCSLILSISSTIILNIIINIIRDIERKEELAARTIAYQGTPLPVNTPGQISVPTY